MSVLLARMTSLVSLLSHLKETILRAMIEPRLYTSELYMRAQHGLTSGQRPHKLIPRW